MEYKIETYIKSVPVRYAAINGSEFEANTVYNLLDVFSTGQELRYDDLDSFYNGEVDVFVEMGVLNMRHGERMCELYRQGDNYKSFFDAFIKVYEHKENHDEK